VLLLPVAGLRVMPRAMGRVEFAVRDGARALLPT
jgi:hypothetical protein